MSIVRVTGMCFTALLVSLRLLRAARERLKEVVVVVGVLSLDSNLMPLGKNRRLCLVLMNPTEQVSGRERRKGLLSSCRWCAVASNLFTAGAVCRVLSESKGWVSCRRLTASRGSL